MPKVGPGEELSGVANETCVALGNSTTDTTRPLWGTPSVGEFCAKAAVPPGSFPDSARASNTSPMLVCVLCITPCPSRGMEPYHFREVRNRPCLASAPPLAHAQGNRHHNDSARLVSSFCSLSAVCLAQSEKSMVLLNLSAVITVRRNRGLQWEARPCWSRCSSSLPPGNRHTPRSALTCWHYQLLTASGQHRGGFSLPGRLSGRGNA